MKVFISWSGNKSKAVAIALREWLPCIFQSVIPWVSAADIGAGQRWATELSKNLEDTHFGILCITADNLKAPWLFFEAGALSKSLEHSYIVPYLIDIGSERLLGSPLAQFQAVNADKEGTKMLLDAINQVNDSDNRQTNVLEKVFNTWWPELDSKLKNSLALPTPVPVSVTNSDGSYFESDGIYWKLENLGGKEKYSPYCPECGNKLIRQVDFVSCKNCGFEDIVTARQPTGNR